MDWARIRNAMVYVNHMRPIVDEVFWNVLTYSHARYVDVPLVFDRFDSFYWYQGCVGWIDDISFARSLRHCNKRDESVFKRWRTKEIFSVPIATRPDLYHLVPEWWFDFLEMSSLYPTVNAKSYMYLASSKMTATRVLSRTFGAVAVA